MTLPIVLDSAGAAIAAVAFCSTTIQACLTFDPSDGPDADSLPDSITGLPAGYEVSVTFNVADTGGEIDISLYDPTAPINALADGTLLSVTFGASACNGGTGASAASFVNFAASPAPSFGDDQGQDMAGTTSGASLTLVFNQAPSDILLSAAAVAENQAPPVTVGTLSAVDANSGDTHTFSLVSGTGDADNASFAIAGNELRTAAAFNFEAQASYSVRVRATDGQGGIFEKPFTISVTDANEPITALALSYSSVDENVATGMAVGGFTPSDPDTADAHSYALVDSVTYPDNAAFAIVGNELRTAAALTSRASQATPSACRSATTPTASRDGAQHLGRDLCHCGQRRQRGAQRRDACHRHGRRERGHRHGRGYAGNQRPRRR